MKEEEEENDRRFQLNMSPRKVFSSLRGLLIKQPNSACSK
jgi:hypothetical protein